MTYHFDERIQRIGTLSVKWDQSEALYGDPDVLPLWIADMDFRCPPAVVKAVTERAQQGIYGYTVKPGEYFEAIIGWFNRRYGWKMDPSWLIQCSSTITSMSIAIQELTEPGDGIILQSPVFNLFYDMIVKNGRKLAESPLVIRNGRYEMDFENLEALMQNGAKMILLCSPHNPGGRVWSREELERMGELCFKYGVKVVSDEIHCDFLFGNNKHVPFASISQRHADMSVTFLSPDKTFNTPGLETSFTVIPNPELRHKFAQRVEALSVGAVNYFGPAIITAGYNDSEDWFDALLDYLGGNLDYCMDYLAEHLPQVKPMRTEGTYLLWIDCRSLGLDSAGLKHFMYKEAKVAFTEGSAYGSTGAGFLRINFGCTREVLAEALERLVTAVKARG